MRTIFYSIFIAGALLTALCMWLMEPIAALITTMLAPLLLLWLAEMFGFIHFVHLEQEEDDSLLAKIREEKLTQDQAIDKYGQAMINEVDQRIAFSESRLSEMKRMRNEMTRIIQERAQ